MTDNRPDTGVDRCLTSGDTRRGQSSVPSGSILINWLFNFDWAAGLRASGERLVAARPLLCLRQTEGHALGAWYNSEVFSTDWQLTGCLGRERAGQRLAGVSLHRERGPAIEDRFFLRN